ncbi:MAG: sulfite exporter TauE/SafE family protein, partial [Brevibacterium aurantiacum]|nr:sulfite exporter TauE/SafE family protein [Brevibacterium aurantiacum]
SSGIEWSIAGALLVGGVIAAPIAAWLVKILPARVLAIAAGGIIILTNARTIALALGASSTTVTITLIALAAAWIALIVHAVRLERRTRQTESLAEVGAEVTTGS